MNDPLVSVIIPTYKRSEFLCATIDSVLAQTYKNIEIIVVDDNGIGTVYQQETEKRLQPYIQKNLITYLCHRVNKNGSAARNTGFSESHGEFINYLDDDDELMPQKIEMQVKCLQLSSNDIGATYCNSKTIRIKGIINKKIEKVSQYSQEGNILKEYLLAKCCFNTSAILFKRKVIFSLNGFDESYYRHQDVELMTRFFANYKIICTSLEPLLSYDISKDRRNVTSCERDYKIKNKYLKQFDHFFSERGIKDEVFHFFWFSCAANAIRNRNYNIFFKAKAQMYKYGTFSFHEYKILLKRFIVSLLAK